MEPIIYEFRTPAAAKTVFDAVATATGIKSWWAKVGTVAEAVGETTELRFDKGGQTAVMTFRIDELKPNSKVRWTCTGNVNPVCRIPH